VVPPEVPLRAHNTYIQRVAYVLCFRFGRARLQAHALGLSKNTTSVPHFFTREVSYSRLFENGPPAKPTKAPGKRPVAESIIFFRQALRDSPVVGSGKCQEKRQNAARGVNNTVCCLWRCIYNLDKIIFAILPSGNFTECSKISRMVDREINAANYMQVPYFKADTICRHVVDSNGWHAFSLFQN
jgi:hypothetical protein